MKTKIMLRIAALIMLAFLFKPVNVSAQALCNGYTVDNNNTSCFARVQITRLCNGTPCGPVITTLIPPSSQYVISPCCGAACSYIITLIGMGATAPLCATSTSVGPAIGSTATASFSAACGSAASCSSVFMHYLPNYTKIF